MNKALIIGPFPGPTKGISFQNEILFNGLKSRNWKVQKIDTEFSKKIVLKSQLDLSNFKLFLRFFEAYKILQVNHIYITIGISFFGVLKYAPFIFLSKLFKKKLIIHVHSGYLETMYNELNGWKKKLVYKILSSFDSGIVLSNCLINNLQPFLKNENIYIVENFIDKNLLKNELIKDYSEIKIIYMSNLLKSKGINDLLLALKSLNEEGIVFKTKVAGNKDEANNVDELLAILPNAEYLGEVKGQEKIDLLTWGNVVCLPTYFKFEGQPISLLEGMAFRNYILTTDHAGIKDFCTNENAVFCKKNNPESLKEQLLYIKQNWETLKLDGYKNGDYALNNFSEDKFFESIINVFDKTLKN
jgi:glycosyltransferase involved in cell wall biosynthesis